MAVSQAGKSKQFNLISQVLAYRDISKHSTLGFINLGDLASVYIQGYQS